MYRLINRITLAAAVLGAVALAGSFLLGGSSASLPESADAAAFCPIGLKSEGSTTVFPITRDSEAPFETLWAPGTDIQLASIGSANGIVKLTAGEEESAPSSRPLSASEATGKYVFKIALDEFVVAVNDSTNMAFLTDPGKGLTRGQLAQIWSAGAGILTLHWDELIAPVIPGAPHELIVPRSRINGSGSYGDWITQLGISTASEDATIAATGEPRLTESVDMANSVIGVDYAIAYTSLANLNISGKKNVWLSQNSPVVFIEPKQETVLDASYPLIRQLFIANRNTALDPRIDNSNFVRTDDWLNYLRSSTTQTLIDAEGFVPVPIESRPPFPDWDVNLDGNTTVSDLGGVINKWGASSNCKGWIRADVNNSGAVSLADIGQVLGKFAQPGFQCALTPANPCPED